MEKLIVLGTGNAMTEQIYHTCFAIRNNEGNYFLVDTGGGNGILRRLTEAQIDIHQIHDLFISHKHSDHLLGVFWVIRKLEKYIADGSYIGNFTIYCHEEVAQIIREICSMILKKRFLELLDKRILIQVVQNKEELSILHYRVQFVDIFAKSDRQYGFKMTLENGRILAFLGDEPLSNKIEPMVKGVDWLLAEAFCLDSQKEMFKPYEKNHSTAKSAARKAETLGVKNLVLWHTEEVNLKHRKQLYEKEAKQYFQGNVLVPEDLEVISLEN